MRKTQDSVPKLKFEQIFCPPLGIFPGQEHGLHSIKGCGGIN